MRGRVDRMSGRTTYQPHGTAIYRREMSVRRTPDGAVGELVDDFHHFRARIVCTRDRVSAVVGESLRTPWTTCAEAEGPLQALVGMRLDPSLRGASRHTPSRRQCTHLFDAAALAIARLGRGVGDVRYTIAIPDRVDGRTVATLERDGEPRLAWALAGNVIGDPPPYAGLGIVGLQLAEWAERTLDAECAEAALLLQRACLISQGRRFDLEAYARAGDVPGGPVGACHTYQPANLERALRVIGSVRNLTDATGRLADRS